MTVISGVFKHAGEILQALDAVRNIRALAVLFASLVVAAVVSTLFLTIGLQSRMRLVGLVGQLFAVSAFVGFNAAGVLLMDEAQGYAQRSTVVRRCAPSNSRSSGAALAASPI